MPKVNHSILEWARDAAKLSIDEAARKLQLTTTKQATAYEKLVSYESGRKNPSRSLLSRMARVYRQPLLVFYLEKPPTKGDRGEDFRTLPEQFEDSENAYLDVLIRDIQARQSMVREILIDEDEDLHLEFIGKCTTDQSIDNIVDIIHRVLDLDIGEYRRQKNYDEAFKYLRNHAEKAGIFVILKGNLGSYHTNISINVFRGFALADEIAPFIVINDQDAKSAWSFTLLHEMAHLLLGQTGVSGAYGEKQIEKFCNDIASEVLLPVQDFAGFTVSDYNFEDLCQQISSYAFQKKISSSHVAYRLYREGNIDKALWSRLRSYFRDQWYDQRERKKVKNREQEGGPDYFVIHRYKLGALASLAKRLNYSGALSTTKAGVLLGVRPLKVHKLFDTGHPA